MYKKEEVLRETLKYFNQDELAANVWIEKYALRNNDGNYLELTPDDMHKRLAREFARIEEKYENPMSEEEIYNYLKHFSFIVPHGSPMSAIGNDYQIQSSGNCFVEGTKIFTNKGVKNIEDVKLGDKVVTHNGRLRDVVQLHKNELNNRQLFEIKAYRTPHIKVTDNHKFMSISNEQLEWGKQPQFNSVEYLRVGDYIQIPNNKQEEEASSFDLNKIFTDQFFYYKKKKYQVERCNDKIKLITITSDGRKKSHKHFVPQVFNVDEDFAYFLGLWYGDGCIFGENTKPKKNSIRNRNWKVCSRIIGISFTFGSDEKKIIEFVLGYLQKKEIVFDLNDNTKLDNTVQIVVHSPILGYAFNNLFGRGFSKKRLHESIFSWNSVLIDSLARGIIDSDGTITSDGDIRVTLANVDLIQDFYHLFRSRNILVGYSESNLKNGSKTARLDFGRNEYFRNNSNKNYDDKRIIENLGNNTLCTKIINGNTFVKLTSKKPIDEKPKYVFTIGVEQDHSFAVEGLICLNCFVIESPYDSYGGILKADQELVQLMKRRAGVGLSLDNIRPCGVKTNNAAKTSDGIGIFMDRFSNSCLEVAQNGRRGALLQCISVHHPDVETFINIKRDKKRVTGANISVKITDEFMNAVKNDLQYQQRFPVDNKENPIISKMVSARYIWDQIIDSAWRSAEPGILFIDTLKRNSSADIYGNIDKAFVTVSTNPCFSGETIIAVADGKKKGNTIADLASSGRDVQVYSIDKITGKVSIKMGRNPRVTGEKKRMVKIHLSGGYSFSVTEEHDIPLLNGKSKKASEIKEGDILIKFTKDLKLLSSSDINKEKDNVVEEENGIVYKRCENCKGMFSVFHIRREIAFCSERCAMEKKQKENLLKGCLGGEHKGVLVKRVEFIEKGGKVYNITVDDNHTVGIMTNEAKGEGVFLSQCGEIPLGGGPDSCRLISINLSSFVNHPFTESAMFDWKKYSMVCQKAQRLMDDLVDIELESIDKIIKKIESDPEPLDVKQIELNLWNNCKRTCIAGRRTGLGVTALGDMIAFLNLKYGTKEAIELTEEVYKQLALNAHYSSCIMAKERGSFPLFNFDLENDSECPYIKRVWNERKDIYELTKEFGRRNIALTTTAPAGSVSCLTQTTSGIEPTYLLKYTRRKKILSLSKEGNNTPDFIDEMGIGWKEYDVHHHGLQKWLDITKKTDIKESPYWGATSMDVDWESSVLIQAVAQKWISHSISKTCNLPKTISKEVIDKIYFKAWESGLKGITVYVDGSRSGVLVEKKENKNNEEVFCCHEAPKRPIELKCDIHHTTINGKKWTVFIGLMNGKPYELFAGESKNIVLPKKCNEGVIEKVNQKNEHAIYNLKIGKEDNEMVIKDIVKVFDNSLNSAFTRILSLSLRHGTSVRFVVEQLSKEKDVDMFSFNRVVARILKKYIPNGEKSSSDKICPSCKIEGLFYVDGCVICNHCGWSKCS